jgi:hypothetical protein
VPSQVADQDATTREFPHTAPAAEWIRNMAEYYFRTGTYRAEDLYRLLGDQRRAASLGPATEFAQHLSKKLP